MTADRAWPARCPARRAPAGIRQGDGRRAEGGPRWPDATAEFFDGLAKRGPEPLLGKTQATVRFDIADGRTTDHWLLGIADDGALDVSRCER